MNNDFDARFSASLDDAARWIANHLTKYGDFGESLNDEVHFMLQQTMLPAAMLVGGAMPTNVFYKGVHVKQISVPEARRRRRYATRVLDRLLAEGRAAGLDYLFVESVLSDEMHALMRGRPEFATMALLPNCYVAVLSPPRTSKRNVTE